jgi:uncharacterized protein with HEPN domain
VNRSSSRSHEETLEKSIATLKSEVVRLEECFNDGASQERFEKLNAIAKEIALTAAVIGEAIERLERETKKLGAARG